jgi:hypothetical protein
MKTIFALLFLATGCLINHDYEGEYDMTWDLISTAPDGTRAVEAGTTHVSIRNGLADELLVDLGPAFCRVVGQYALRTNGYEQPSFTIPPQDCRFLSGDKLLPLTLGGTGTFVDDERLQLVLTGALGDGAERSSVTLDLSESW